MSQKVRSYLEMNRMVERAFAVMLLVLSTQADEAKEDGLGNDHGCTDFKSPAGTGRDNTYRTGGPKFIPAGPGGCLFHPFVEQKRFLLSGL